MGKCGVFFGIPLFAAVMQDAGGQCDAVLAFLGVDALHIEQVASDAYHGAGMAYEAALAQADGGVVFAGGGGWH